LDIKRETSSTMSPTAALVPACLASIMRLEALRFLALTCAVQRWCRGHGAGVEATELVSRPRSWCRGHGAGVGPPSNLTSGTQSSSSPREPLLSVDSLKSSLLETLADPTSLPPACFNRMTVVILLMSAAPAGPGLVRGSESSSLPPVPRGSS
jgi:hypothetical protein